MSRLFIPEYSITTKILGNISSLEYSKAVIENTAILPSWESKLIKESQIREIYSSLRGEGINLEVEQIKYSYENLAESRVAEVSNFKMAFDYISNNSRSTEVTEQNLCDLNRLFYPASNGAYRNTREPDFPEPDEILAKIVEIFDWLRDSYETHPIISASVLKLSLEAIKPFRNFNSATVNFIVILWLKIRNYSLKDCAYLSDYYRKTKQQFEYNVSSIIKEEDDMTGWLEYFSEGLSIEANNLKEKIKLLAKDTKIAKATGQVKLSDRQARIVEYLQDYGLIQNRDFGRIFPDKSEDSILRDLKTLTDLNIVQKVGKTKSSRYELIR